MTDSAPHSGSPADRPSPQLPRCASWPENRLRAILNVASTTPARRTTVLAEIDEGSKPTGRAIEEAARTELEK